MKWPVFILLSVVVVASGWLLAQAAPAAGPFLKTSAAFDLPTEIRPDGPELLEPQENSDYTVTLAWSDLASLNSDVVGYLIFYYQDGRWYLRDLVGLDTTWTDDQTNPGLFYAYKVAGLLSDGTWTEFSNVGQIIVSGTPGQ
jgi:hypothetical protein